MRFGKTLARSIHPPWAQHYIDYAKLKHLLREDDDKHSSSAGGASASDGAHEEREWTEHDESAFVDELINVQLEKVARFQSDMSQQLQDRTKECEARLEKAVAAGEEIDGGWIEELDKITGDMNELERFSRINFTGFMKAGKKHDRRSRGKGKGGEGKGGKGKTVEGGAGGDPKVKPLLQVRLSQLEFNKEDYSPLLYRLSTMYDFVRQNMKGDNVDRPLNQSTTTSANGSKRYTSLKFWVHPDNILEVKTFVLRRLPVLVYNPQPSKEIDPAGSDPTITSLYFDSPQFTLYDDKVLKSKDASSLRLRWYGHLSDSPEILLERKTIRGSADDSEGAIEERIPIKAKYVNDFINGTYSMEKTVQKMHERKPDDSTDVEKYKALVQSIQDFITEKDLQPALRASYTRTAFQIPGDDRIRVSLDMDLALIREDALDTERPCRDPEDWHRKDIDDAKMSFPFPLLRKGEISRFPYGLLEIKIRESELHPRSREWVQELASSHLVHPSPRFSKFLHGVGELFDDYVNNFPFWLGELDKDIRRDPKKAWEEEQSRVRKQQDDETAVGSFRIVSRDFGGRGSGTPPKPFNPASFQSDSSLNDGKFPRAAPQGSGHADVKILQPSEPASDADEADEPEQAPRSSNPLDTFRHLFPSFTSTSTSRYGRAHSRRPPAPLPPGVTKPRQLLMHKGPIQVESKVWLANQRTFIKWMHIAVLLASLSVALYNAAGADNPAAKGIALAYTAVSVWAGAWGWGMYMWRSKLIRERSGRDFDNVLGPVVVCVALAAALVVNFGFKYKAAVERHHGGAGHGGNETVTATIMAAVASATGVTELGEL
ncbi:VTC domain-containing protein [Geopyxis carbonaria]|nr:VTC domain-containing protein [Geopyxis carbonaria]